MARGLHGPGFRGAALGAAAGLLAVFGAGRFLARLPLAEFVARGLDRLGLGGTALGAGVEHHAVLGAGGRSLDDAVIPGVLRAGLHLLIGYRHGHVLATHGAGYHRLIGLIAVDGGAGHGIGRAFLINPGIGVRRHGLVLVEVLDGQQILVGGILVLEPGDEMVDLLAGDVEVRAGGQPGAVLVEPAHELVAFLGRRSHPVDLIDPGAAGGLGIRIVADVAALGGLHQIGLEQCIVSQVQGGQLIVVAQQLDQLGLAGQVEGSQPVAVAVQLGQLRNAGQVQRRQLVDHAVHAGQRRMAAGLQDGQLVIGAVQRRQLGHVADVQRAGQLIAGAAQIGQIHVLGHVQRGQLVGRAAEVVQCHVGGDVQRRQFVVGAGQLLQLQVLADVQRRHATVIHIQFFQIGAVAEIHVAQLGVVLGVHRGQPGAALDAQALQIGGVVAVELGQGGAAIQIQHAEGGLSLGVLGQLHRCQRAVLVPGDVRPGGGIGGAETVAEQDLAVGPAGGVGQREESTQLLHVVRIVACRFCGRCRRRPDIAGGFRQNARGQGQQQGHQQQGSHEFFHTDSLLLDFLFLWYRSPRRGKTVSIA